MPTRHRASPLPQNQHSCHLPASKLRALGPGNRVRGQRGFGLAKVLLVLLLVVFFVNLGIKMLPSYLTFLQVRSLMERVVERPELVGGGSREVLGAVRRQLGIDSLRSVDTQDFRVFRDGEEILLGVDYQVQKHIGFNVDVLMHFDHSVVLPRP